MLHNTILTLSYLALFGLSAYFYKNNPKYYAVDKDEKSAGTLHFYSIVNVWLRISTLVVALWSVFSNSRWLLIVHDNLTITYTGVVLSWIGIYLFIRAKQDLGKNYSPCYDAYLPHDITKEGLYRLVRHPIYTSNIFTLSAIFITCGSLWILLNVILLIYYYNKSAAIEEAELTSRYTDYGDYVKRTNRYFPSPRQVFDVIASR
jgi:protein-S-isoprenylcysteine O-methyltransferase Ste14